MKRIIVAVTVILSILFVFSCEDFFLDPEPIGHINSYDSEYTGDIEGRAEIKISSGTTEIENNSTYTLSGSLEVYETHQFSFTIENESIDTELNLTGTTLVSVGGTDATLFSIRAQPSAAIAAGSSTTFTLDYAPTEAGTNACILTIENDDADKSPFVINISATATFTPLGTALADDFADAGGSLVEIISDSYIAPRDATAAAILVDGAISVRPGVTLTIYEGVTLDMANYSISVDGTLYVEGTDDNRVKFTGSNWGGITINGIADINGAIISEYYSSSGYGINIAGGDVAITNCRIMQPGTSVGIRMSDPEADSVYVFSNNIFCDLESSNQPGIDMYNVIDPPGLTVMISNNTFIAKGTDGYAIDIPDDEASTYLIENNIFAGDSDMYYSAFYFVNPGPIVSVDNNIYDDRVTSFGHGEAPDSPADLSETNLAFSWSNSTIFTNFAANDFRLKQTTTYPSLAQANNIAELEGCLTNGHANEVGAYGNGGYPPDFNE